MLRKEPNPAEGMEPQFLDDSETSDRVGEGLPLRRDRIPLFKRRAFVTEAIAVGAIALFLMVLMPPLLSDFRLNLLGRFLALAIVALGIDLIWGYTGLLSLGHGIFFALGGYALAMHLKLQVPSGEVPDFMELYGVTKLPWFWQPFHSFGFSLIAILVIPGVVAGLLGYLVFRNRIRGVYFSILTQAMTIVFFNFFNGQQQFFNGTNGLIDFKTLLGVTVSDRNTQRVFYCLTVVFVAAAYALCRWLTQGRFGRLLVAIRDDESRVRFSGYNPTGFKVFVFTVSAILAGMSGALYTLQTGSISPRQMDIATSIEMVIWVAVGGRGTLIGAVLGTLLVNYARTFFSESAAEVWLFFQGALFLLVVLVLPDGVVGWVRDRGWNWLRSLFGQKRLVTYPRLETDPEIQQEREALEESIEDEL